MNKRGKISWAIIIFILVIVILIYIFGFPRDGCETDADCPPISENICLNSSACVQTTTYRCNNESGWFGQCEVAGGGIGCYYCPNGCLNGECIPPNNGTNGTDLIINNITWMAINPPTTQGDLVINMTVIVENIGTFGAGQSRTRLYNEGIVLAHYITPAIPAGEIKVLSPPVNYTIPAGEKIKVTAVADFTNMVPESNEDNNDKTIRIPF